MYQRAVGVPSSVYGPASRVAEYTYLTASSPACQRRNDVKKSFVTVSPVGAAGPVRSTGVAETTRLTSDSRLAC
ncbi:hypothetical protein [Streptomyces virginiae]|uniref:hypothetical protein n=1 Tax=Streptomyces virginiae TaxID=1961 RepID=UPI00345272F4